MTLPRPRGRTDGRPHPGDLLIVDERASVQFAGARALTFRVVSVSDRPTYHGWVWMTGYVIGRRGDATVKREIFVRLAGLRPAPPPPEPGRQAERRPLPRRATFDVGPTAR
ncbi:hypothetical protein [Micromonospora sp. SH-82]|uniref:hypothetical protein n=1 Tax=Micromonospora sp. SH-82 TaxID=3132938 RepID=UPI003EB7C870